MLNASFERLGSINNVLGQSDRLESRSHVEVELEVAVAGGMCSCRELVFQPPLDNFFRAYALENTPALTQISGGIHNVVDLVPPREGAAVQQNMESNMFGEQICGGLQHDFLAEIVLHQRIFDVRRLEKGRANCRVRR